MMGRQAHNEMVAKLWEDFRAGNNQRVPCTFATDEFLWLKLTGHSFREFYTDPRVQVETILTGTDWLREYVPQDAHMGPPGEWHVVPRFWMDEPECFGCEVIIQEDDFAWSLPLEMSKPDILAYIEALDPREMVLQSRLWKLNRDMKDIVADMTFRDRPVSVFFPGGGTHGVFTMATRVRGAEQLCLDIAEDPAFADRFIGLIADKTVERIRAWHELDGTGQTPPLESWGSADDALELISADTFRELVLPHWQRVYDAMTTGFRGLHLCGYATQHFPLLHQELGIEAINGPGTFADHGALLARMPKLRISAQVDHMVVHRGPVEAIDDMMRSMLNPRANQAGRFDVSGFLFRDTPLEHCAAMYEAAKRYGSTDGV